MRTISTRTIFSLLLIFGMVFKGFSQNTYTGSDKYPKWRLGLNMGGTWQTSDIKKNYAGLAGGFNIERVLNRREDAPVGFSLGFRYLSGSTYGYDNRQNTNLAFNNGLNGVNNPLANYDSISTTSSGYFYNNYYTKLAEGNLELKINFPAMEKRTHFIFHVFGGAGFTKYTTKINALDDSLHMFKYTSLASSPSVSSVKSFYGTGKSKFESYADGNNADGNLVFTPSVGLGVGYRFNKYVSFVVEHKVSFPCTNVLDGEQYSTSSSKPTLHDIYHYTAANLIFTIWGKHHTSGTYTTTPNTTTTNTTTTNQTNPTTYTPVNNGPKPIVSIYTPSTNPYTTNNGVQQVNGVAQYITSSNQLNITINGSAPANGFAFNPNNGSFSFDAYLAPGNNNVNITATNNAGSDTKSETIIYSAPQNPVYNNNNPNIPPPVVETPPKVTITYPANNYITNTPSVNVNAVVTNVPGSNNIAISANGYAITNFNYNPYNGSVSFVAPLMQGNNQIVVSAFNTAGNDAQQVFVTYTPPNQTTPVIITPPAEQKPVVSYNNPSSSPFQSITPVFNVTAKVTNVTSANQVTVQYNGLPVTNFTFSQYGFVNFTVNLNSGSNTVVVTGTNNAGSDTKTATINYKEAGFPPVVTIINPSVNPSSTNAASATVMANVTNVTDQSNIFVLVNNAVSPFTYNTSNQTVTVPVSLNVGSNSIKISATTNFGSDSKTQVIERREMTAKPVVTILNPGVNPATTGVTPANVLAQVLNVSGPKQITVKDGNNTDVPFSYNNATQQVTFSPALNSGPNTFVVTGTNLSGSDSKSVTINYTIPKVIVPVPTVTIVNPASNPFITTDGQTIVKATTTNVMTQQEVSVSVNGAAANFNFNTTTKEVEVPTSLIVGTNTITISVSNQGGSDSKTQIIDRMSPPKILLPLVTILNPQTSPFVSPTATYTVTAEVLNVTASSDITVTLGTTAVPFNYDNVTHIVSFTANLANGSSTYTVKGTNAGGSDSKSVTLSFIKRVTVGDVLPKKPVVTITNPANANTIVTTSTQAVTATITNIANASQAGVLINGVSTTTFTYNNGTVTFTANLNIGNNTITVTGTNSAGSDSKTVSILYNKTAVNAGIDKPVVIITNPSTAISSSGTPTDNITATVTNVINASQVSVMVNGAPLSNFNFNNGTVTFTANLNLGSNTVSVTGTNAAGSDSKSVTINYIRTAVNTGIDKPVVTIMSPANNAAVTTATQNVTSTVTNVINASQVTVLVNNIPTTNFTFSNGNISFIANLNLGGNTVTVTGTNAAGSDTKSITIQYLKSAVNAGIDKPVVIITTPATVNSSTTNSTQAVVSTVTNVINASQVSVNVNGTPVPNFAFSNGNVTFTANLNLGNNTVTVTGTNAAGSDSKTVNIQYTKSAVNAGIDKPVVTILTPNVVNTNTQLPTQPIVATVTNVINASQVTVQVNNIPLTNFTFNNGNVSFTANLNSGSNTVTITGTNAAGSDSKTVFINYTKPREVEQNMEKPVVTFTNPSTAMSATNNAMQNITATVTNVINASQVKVIVNNAPTTNFTFNNGAVGLNTMLNQGPNVISITGTNVAGYDTKSITITYNKQGGVADPGNLAPKPIVTITSNNQTTPNSTENVTANIQFVNSASQVSVTVNGSNMPNFTYNNGNISFDANLNYGNNTAVVTGTNAAGSDSKTVTIYRRMPPAPLVTIVNPSTSPYKTSKKETSVTATVQNVASSNEISVTADNGAQVPFAYNGGTMTLSFNYTLTTTYTTFTVSATNAGGSDSKTVTFKYEEEVRNNGVTDLITICHYPNGPGSTPQTIQIPTSDWPTHQAHGDYQGGCTATNGGNGNGNGNGGNGNGNNNDPMITICHYPPGNTNNPQQLTIPTSAWPAHQAHGDVQGTCPATTNGNGNNGGGNGNNGNGGNNNGNGGNGNGNNNNNDPMITICHYPPGNTNNPQQITIPTSAWSAHQAHGDVLGGCPATPNGNGNNGNGNNNGNGGNNNNNGNNNGGGGKLNIGGSIIPKIISSPQTEPPKNTNTNQQNTTPAPTNNTPRVIQPQSTPQKTETTTQPKKEEENKPAPRVIKPQ